MTRRRTNLGRGRSKTARAVDRAVRAAGGTVGLTARGHLRVTGPAGVAVVPSDPHLRNIRALVRTIEKHTGLTLDMPL